MSEQVDSTSETHAEKAGSHEAGYGSYIMVWLGLVGLTALTVTVAGLKLGSITLATALAIAAVKSTLVGTYFMHVKSDSKLIKAFIGVCLMVFVIIMLLTFSDLSFR